MEFSKKTCKKPKPSNKKLYERTKKKVKKRVSVWPSAYASGQLVRQYKLAGGTYSCSFGSANPSLGRWFKEKWVNVCAKAKCKNVPWYRCFKPCGRKSSKKGKYPYCRPSIRVTPQTPRTVKEMGKAKIKEMCKRKKSSKKIFQ